MRMEYQSEEQLQNSYKDYTKGNCFCNPSLSSQDIKNLIGLRIRNRREFLCLSQKDLADRIFRRREHINRLEQGVASLHIDLLLTISQALEVHPFYFLRGIVYF
jgi:ribosome-binding protein aMBF1 (putative translation factor)